MPNLKRLLIVLGEGGHTEQMIRLVEDIGKEYRYIYLITNEDHSSSYKIKNPGEIVRVFNLRKKKDKNLLIVAFKSIINIFDSIKVLIRENPNYILSSGPGMSLPIIILGKMFGKKVIFLESWSRVYTQSLSGRIAYHFSDLFFVQWKELKVKYPKAIYAGRLG